MIMDLALPAYCWFGADRGQRRKLSGTVYRLIKVTVAAMMGFSLFKLSGRILSLILGSFMSDSLRFVPAFALLFLVLQRTREQLTGRIEKKIGQEKNSRWNAIAGFTASLLIGLVPDRRDYPYGERTRPGIRCQVVVRAQCLRLVRTHRMIGFMSLALRPVFGTCSTSEACHRQIPRPLLSIAVVSGCRLMDMRNPASCTQPRF